MAEISFLKLVIVDMWSVTPTFNFSIYFPPWKELKFCFGDNSNHSDIAQT